jgi:hypothetical protein
MRFVAITLCVVMFLGAVCVSVGVLCADETEDFIKEVIAGSRSDAQRSGRLLEAAGRSENNKKLRVALLEKSIEYGMKGLRTSDDCTRVLGLADMLVQSVPEKEPNWLAQKGRVYRRMYIMAKSRDDKAKFADKAVDMLIQAAHSAATKGDWKTSISIYSEAKSAAILYKQFVKFNLAIRIRAISCLTGAREKTGKYITALAKSPDDADLRSRLVKTLLVTLDDPAGAVKYVNNDVEQIFQAYVPMAARDISEVSMEECGNLSEWYHKELSKNALPLVKHRMLKKALAYQKRALSLYDKSDIKGEGMKHRIARIESELAKVSRADPLICVYCFSTGKTPCPPCMVSGKSTGKRQCAKCKNSGQMKCTACNGIHGITCKTCDGRGFVGLPLRGGRRRRPGLCSTCFGQCYMHYSVSSKRYRAGMCPSCRYHSPKGSADCSACDGGGGKACPKCYGSKTLHCTHCPSK